MNKTTRIGLQEPENTPQVFSTSVESLNTKNLQTLNNRDGSMSNFHVGCGYNLSRKGKSSLSARVFVLGVDGKPLTPVKPQRAKRLMKEKQAKPVWNKFSKFGIEMLVETRKETPKIVLGQDWGTKFEGYSLISGKENVLNVIQNRMVITSLQKYGDNKMKNNNVSIHPYPNIVKDMDFLAKELNNKLKKWK